MIEQKNIGTGEPVGGQAPTPTAENKTPVSTATDTNTNAPASPSTTAMAQNIQNALTRATLPDGYLSNGSMLDEDGAIRPEYIGKYAQILAEKLKPLKASAFYTAFLKEAKEARKKKVAYGAKKNCALGMVTQAKKLTARKKEPAPAVLLDIMTAATATVDSPATFEALYMHLDAVYSYLLTD